MTYEFLDPEFLEAMNDIGRYGFNKFKDKSFTAIRRREDRNREDFARSAGKVEATAETFAEHARQHFAAYMRGEKHDKFGTLQHQLAAAAFNIGMEFFFANLVNEEIPHEAQPSDQT